MDEAPSPPPNGSGAPAAAVPAPDLAAAATAMQSRGAGAPQRRPAADEENSLLACVVAGLIGSAVALLCLVPPGLHFLTGPLGPLIGGAIAGARVRARGGDAFVIGMVLGGGVLLAGALLGGIAVLVVSPELLGGATGEPSVASSLRNPEVIVAVALGLFTYEALVGWIGAKLGAWIKRIDD